LKQIPYQIDPIIPFMGDDRFSRLNPVRRIPVLIDDCVTLADSSAICQYLGDRYSKPRLYPVDIADRAQARWLEEFGALSIADISIAVFFRNAMFAKYSVVPHAHRPASRRAAGGRRADHV